MTKLCTDIRQSKRLQELGLDPMTADLSWYCIDTDHQDYLNSGFSLELEPYSDYKGITGYEPAWSLPKLMDMLPPRLYYHGEEYFMEFFKTPKGEWVIQYPKQGTLFPIVCHQESFDSSIDAIYQMICYLQEELDEDFTTNKPNKQED